MAIGIYIGKVVKRSTSWTASIYILKSGAIWYKRERNTTLGYFKLWYSSDSGATWGDEPLVSMDITEDNPLIDTTHIYHHRIVGTAYKSDNFLTALGWSGVESLDGGLTGDYINLFST